MFEKELAISDTTFIKEKLKIKCSNGFGKKIYMEGKYEVNKIGIFEEDDPKGFLKTIMRNGSCSYSYYELIGSPSDFFKYEIIKGDQVVGSGVKRIPKVFIQKYLDLLEKIP